LIYKNFKAIGDDSKAIMTLILTLIFSSLLFWGFVNLPEEIMDKIPDIVFTLLYTAIIYFVYHTFFAKLINPLISEEENKASNWLVAGYTLFGLIITLAIILWFSYEQPTFSGDIANFGKADNEVYYDANNIDSNELNIVGNTLTSYGYFDDESQASVQIQEFDGKYELSLVILYEYFESKELMAFIDLLKNDLENQLNKKVDIIIITYNKEGETITKKID